MTSRRIAAVAVLLVVAGGVLVVLRARREPTRGTPSSARAPELHDVDLNGWPCAGRDAGIALTAHEAERHRLKNRPWRTPPPNVPQWTYAQFVDSTRAFSAAAGVEPSAAVTAQQARRLASAEGRIVSVTGWIVIAYMAGLETTNCMDPRFIDWHIEVVPSPFTHSPRAGDPTAIIGEITPHTEGPLYRTGIRVANLAAFIRVGDAPSLRFVPTGIAPQRVRVTGYLFFDDGHDGPSDVGASVRRGGGGVYQQPWRVSAWEIHPILSIEILDSSSPSPAR